MYYSENKLRKYLALATNRAPSATLLDRGTALEIRYVGTLHKLDS